MHCYIIIKITTRVISSMIRSFPITTESKSKSKSISKSNSNSNPKSNRADVVVAPARPSGSSDDTSLQPRSGAVPLHLLCACDSPHAIGRNRLPSSLPGSKPTHLLTSLSQLPAHRPPPTLFLHIQIYSYSSPPETQSPRKAGCRIVQPVIHSHTQSRVATSTPNKQSNSPPSHVPRQTQDQAKNCARPAAPDRHGKLVACTAHACTCAPGWWCCCSPQL